MIRAACVQLRASDDVAANIRDAVALIREAHGQGATFIATPENTSLMAPDAGAKLENSFAEDADPALPVFRALAAELGVWLSIGSLAIKVSADKTANRSFLIAPDGSIAARYDKIHLYDVDLPSGERYRESRTVAGGHEAVLQGDGVDHRGQHAHVVRAHAVHLLGLLFYATEEVPAAHHQADFHAQCMNLR